MSFHLVDMIQDDFKIQLNRANQANDHGNTRVLMKISVNLSKHAPMRKIRVAVIFKVVLELASINQKLIFPVLMTVSIQIFNHIPRFTFRGLIAVVDPWEGPGGPSPHPLPLIFSKIAHFL